MPGNLQSSQSVGGTYYAGFGVRTLASVSTLDVTGTSIQHDRRLVRHVCDCLATLSSEVMGSPDRLEQLYSLGSRDMPECQFNFVPVNLYISVC